MLPDPLAEYNRIEQPFSLYQIQVNIKTSPSWEGLEYLAGWSSLHALARYFARIPVSSFGPYPYAVSHLNDYQYSSCEESLCYSFLTSNA